MSKNDNGHDSAAWLVIAVWLVFVTVLIVGVSK